MSTTTYRILSLFIATFVVCGIGIADTIPVGPLPGISGAAWLAENTLLVAHDSKVSKDGNVPQPRVSLLVVPTEGEATCNTVDIDWSTVEGGIPNDLESICAIVDKPGEFALIESSYEAAKYGRIIHLRATLDGAHCTVQILGMTHFPATLKDGTEFDNVEGAQTFLRDGKTCLMLGKRGKNDKKARLCVGKLDWNAPLFAIDEDHAFDTPFKDFDVKQDKRYCSELLLVGNDLYTVSCNDPGDDGPFSSVVYRLGSLAAGGPECIQIGEEKTELIRYNGHKVEALAPLGADKATWLAATDDENFRGTTFRMARP